MILPKSAPKIAPRLFPLYRELTDKSKGSYNKSGEGGPLLMSLLRAHPGHDVFSRCLFSGTGTPMRTSLCLVYRLCSKIQGASYLDEDMLN